MGEHQRSGYAFDRGDFDAGDEGRFGIDLEWRVFRERTPERVLANRLALVVSRRLFFRRPKETNVSTNFNNLR
jgi:hypothetical protein